MTHPNHSPEVSPQQLAPTGAGAAAAPAPSAIRPLVLRSLIGALAILGLSGIGAASMLAGLEGAHASPPEASSVWLGASSANVSTPTNATPTASNTPSPVSSNAPIPGAEANSPTACPTRTEDGKIILNRAGVEDFRKIPGIGPKRAEALLALRTKLKRFTRPAELLRVKGIGPKSLVRMQPHFVLNDPKGNDCEQAAKPPTPPTSR